MIDELVGKTLAGKYRLEELIRENEYESVYRGQHLLMEKPVTVKILASALAVDESIVNSFSVEARTISRLSHPNILNVTDFGKDEDRIVFIVMESAEGDSLKEALRKEGAFGVERAVKIARQIAAALSSAHANGIVHRRLTSENVLLTEMGNGSELVKVFDLGSLDAVGREDLDDEDSLERLAYFSPEQCSEESEVDERSDIYSLGVIFYEMLVGEVPFTADNPTDLMLKHAEVPPPPFAAFRDDIPEEIEPIALRALAKNPDMRYQDASAFAEDLSEAARLDGIDDSIVISQVDPAAIPQSNNVWKTAFVVLAGISLLAFGLIYWTNVKQTNPTTVGQIDEDGQPVQPLNPATGLPEQNLPNMAQYPTNSLGSDDLLTRPDVGGGGGDGYDPWARPGTPPGGKPTYQPPIGPGGDVVTVPGNSGSIFTQDDFVGYDDKGNPIYLVRKPIPTKSPEKPDSKGKTDIKKDDPKATADKPKGDGGTTVKKPEAAKKPTPKPKNTPAVEKKPEKKPVEKPKSKPTSPAKSKKKVSGREQDA